MTNIFDNHERKQNRRKRLAVWGFYGPVLFLFALLVASKEGGARWCFTPWLCGDANDSIWKTAAVIYLYLLLFSLAVIYGYQGLVRLAGHQKRMQWFARIFAALPVVAAVMIFGLHPGWERSKAIWWIAVALVSVVALLLIEIRKK